MKKVLVFLGILLFLQLGGQTRDEPLDLGKYIIEGESGIFADSIKVNQNLEKYWQIDNKSTFDHYRKMYRTVKPGLVLDDETKNIYLRGLLGDQDFVKAHLITNDNVLNIFNFNLSAENLKRSESWRDRKGDFHWQPNFSKLYFSAGAYYQDINSEILETQVTGVDLEIKSNNIPLSEKLSMDLKLRGVYNIYEQLSQEKEDFDGIIDLKLSTDNIDFKAKLDHKKEVYSTDLNLSYLDLGTFVKIGLWFGSNEDRPMVMMLFNLVFTFSDKVNFYVENNPETISKSWTDEIRESRYILVENDNSFQSLKPIDLVIGLLLKNISSSIYYNLESYLDYPLYFLSSSQDFIGSYQEEFIRHQFCADTKLDLAGFHLENNFAYRINKKYPDLIDLDFSDSETVSCFEPQIVDNLVLTYQLFPVDLSISCLYESGVEYNIGKRFEDRISLDAEIGLRSTKFLKFLVGAQNIINRDNIDFPGDEPGKLILWGGVELEF